MSTYTQLLYHLVFSTKNRKKALLAARQEKLYKYIWGILQKKKCHLYRVGGVEDHLHIITHIHPSIAISGLIKDIKVASSLFINSESIFPEFDGWQNGYGAFTNSIKEKDRLIEYVKNQRKHHESKCFRKEFVELLSEHGVQFETTYLL
jgi:REP element-mobilizing transposase RayT